MDELVLQGSMIVASKLALRRWAVVASKLVLRRSLIVVSGSVLRRLAVVTSGLVLFACSDPAGSDDAGVGLPDAAVLDASLPDADLLDADPPDSTTPPDAGTPVNPLDGMGTVELIDMGYSFTEGPTWRAADGVLLFSDIQANTIYRLTPPSTVDVFRMPSERANGLASDRDGLLLACEHESRRVTRTMSDGTIMAIAERFEGDLLSSPNDLVVRSDNTIYFSDPPFGLGNRMREVAFNGVYRIDPSGVLTAEWRGAERTRPNGLALSPDETILYLAESADSVLRAFDVAPDGSLSNDRVFTATGGVGDGMAVDDAGNIYLTTMAGIEVYAPDATQWGTIVVPLQPANVAFGGPERKTLYITARTRIYRVEMPIAGGN